MFKSKFFLPLAAGVLSLLFAAGAQAQATRTWVSGVGDDVNPCSRTAPCKTFAGAISKTAAGGEISVLDPAGFGVVTITKAITINGTGTLGGILSAGSTGIIVNAGANDIVRIRDISINGANTGLHGVRFLAGKELHLDNVTIQGVTQNGIDFQPTGESSLFVDNTTITGVFSGDSTTLAAVVVRPGASGQASAVFTNTRVEGNRIGFLINDRSNVVLDDCSVSRNAVLGAWVRTTTGPATLFLKDSTFAMNGPVPTYVTNGTALRSEGTNSTIRMATTVVTGSEIGLLAPGGAILSYGDNQVSGNGFDGSPTGFITDI